MIEADLTRFAGQTTVPGYVLTCLQLVAAGVVSTAATIAFIIGLDHGLPGISTDLARGPETTGITDMIRVNKTREGTAPLPCGMARLRCLTSTKPQVRISNF
jgi:hypothetical protein